ncbi:MAG: hypothetical protein HUU37_03745 [Bdellovibrionales bacterium]|nr:hypothetical protein [Bdellovibrionales bacterium]
MSVVKTVKALSFVGLTLLVSGCGKQEHKDSYQLTENGCSTGKKEFEADSQEELTQKVCAALKDDAQNNNCAYGLRKKQFEQKCLGQTW